MQYFSVLICLAFSWWRSFIEGTLLNRQYFPIAVAYLTRLYKFTENELVYLRPVNYDAHIRAIYISLQVYNLPPPPKKKNPPLKTEIPYGFCGLYCHSWKKISVFTTFPNFKIHVCVCVCVCVFHIVAHSYA